MTLDLKPEINSIEWLLIETKVLDWLLLLHWCLVDQISISKALIIMFWNLGKSWIFIKIHLQVSNKFDIDFRDYTGPKGKSPWITDDDGTVVADSQFIIEYLTVKRNIRMLNLSPDDAAITRGMRAILEDNLYFVLMSENSLFGNMKLLTKIYQHLLPQGAPKCYQQLVLRKVKANLTSQARAQGTGRHNRLFCVRICLILLGKKYPYV